MKLFIIGLTFFSYNFCLALPGKISLNLSYKSSGDDLAKQKAVVEEGRRLEAHYKRGDIDTFISMAPRQEIHNGKKIILIDFEIQNMREGDLISESNAQVQTISGETVDLLVNDDQLNETLKVSVTPKSL